MAGLHPVGGFVSGQHVADAGCAAVWAADHREPLQSKGRPGAVSQQVFETPKIAGHIAVDERDPHARIDRKPAVHPGEHAGGGRRVQEARTPEPADHAATHPLGERGQIGLVDWPRRQERRRRIAPCIVGTRRHEDAVGHAGVEVHMVVERRAKAMQKGDATEPRAGGCGGVGISRDTCRSADQPLDLVKKDLREGCDGSGAVCEKPAQPLRHRNHPLPHTAARAPAG